VKSRLIIALAASAGAALLPSLASAQRQAPPTPEQRLDRLEKQVQQVQRQLFPKGRPADTAGFADDPAATQSSVVGLDQRLDALERQVADLVRQSEENGNRLRNVETGIGQLKSDQDQRIAALEQRMSEAAAAPPVQVSAVTTAPAATPPKAKPPTAKPSTPKTSAAAPPVITTPAGTPATDAGEEAYTANPSGERAQDSLYYLGQALMKLGQPGQACKAYAELDAVYGAKVRPDLKKLETEAKAQAQCG